jgi:Zn-dependent peptidase ImmA (M78 family)
VPEFVVRFIVYHEMLHAIFGEKSSTPSRRHHPPEFQRAEKAYPDYDRAKKFLREYFGRRRRPSDD